MKNTNQKKLEYQLELPGINTGYYEDFISSTNFNLPNLDQENIHQTNYVEQQLNLFFQEQCCHD
jgi:hypothetical protein